MNKIKKIFWGLVIALVVLVVAAAIVAGLFLDKIVKAGIETIGPNITGVSVTVDAVHLSLLTGSAKIDGLVIGNPKGYDSPQAISVGVTAIGVNPASVLTKKIVVRSIEVRNPEVTFEGSPFSGNNLTKIRDNVSGAPAPTASQIPSTNQPAQIAASQAGRKYEVDDFLISGAKVYVKLTGVGVAVREMTLPLPEIHLTDLGKGGDGITATELTKRALDALTAATIKVVASEAGNLGKGAEKIVGGNVNKITKDLGGFLKK